MTPHLPIWQVGVGYYSASQTRSAMSRFSQAARASRVGCCAGQIRQPQVVSLVIAEPPLP